MRAEILRSIEKRLRGAQPDQAELLAIAKQLQEILGYALVKTSGDVKVTITNTDGGKWPNE